ncbi:hypothetical protein jhhlp_001698 [Lomentospora prolificans]|uniref:Heterokaryon incompatibility domain-containing protein n=1 Tax=Lomentospora prolificans TaxID=41688 RepID=A0A2N3NGY9_9PEZI|nr:hypothetical protein jhhlp_001698 [Lomentospora prolificans]
MERDKILNRQSGFKYPAMDAKKNVRLLRMSACVNTPFTLNYSLEAVSLEDLCTTRYTALSYTWGTADSDHDICEIKVGGRPFFVRRNLFSFLSVAAKTGLYGLIFIDAICINQLDNEDRRIQVQNMTSIYRNADEVISWLGIPAANRSKAMEALEQAKSFEHKKWTKEQWEGFRCISHHPYWSRIWVIQEVVLAQKVSVWCGQFRFPISLLGGVGSPADTILTHRLRPFLRRRKDVEAVVGTMDEITAELWKPTWVGDVYKSTVPDNLYELMAKFRDLGCSDPRDRLYGLLGIIHKRSAAAVEVDYSRDVRHAYRQALKVGIQELYWQRGPFARSPWSHVPYMTFLRDARDAFGIGEEEAAATVQEVLENSGFRELVQADLLEAQWDQETASLIPIFRRLVATSIPKDTDQMRFSRLYRLHARQYKLIDSASEKLRSVPLAQRRRMSPKRGIPNGGDDTRDFFAI